jgi:hypothetical protein
MIKEYNQLVEVLSEVSTACGMEPTKVISYDRGWEVSTVRKLFWMVAKSKYPQISDGKLAGFSGRSCHTGVMRGIKEGYSRVKSGDPSTLEFYEKVRHMFTNVEYKKRKLWGK